MGTGRAVLAASAAVAVAVGAAWLARESGGAAGEATGVAPVPPWSAPPAGPAGPVRAVVEAPAAATAAVTPPPHAAPVAAGVAPPTGVAMDAPRALQVGETAEVTIALAPPGARAAAVDGAAFELRVDPAVLQVRAVAEGAWVAEHRGEAAFAADIAPGEDGVRVRVSLRGRGRGHGSAGAVASVQVQAVAPGDTFVTLSDVALTDAAGRPLAARVLRSSEPVAVEPPLPRARPDSAGSGGARGL